MTPPGRVRPQTPTPRGVAALQRAVWENGRCLDAELDRERARIRRREALMEANREGVDLFTIADAIDVAPGRVRQLMVESIT